MHRWFCTTICCLLLAACSTRQDAAPSIPRQEEVAVSTAEKLALPPPSTQTYAERIQKSVRRNLVLTEPIEGNPSAEVEVHTLTDGSIVGVKLVKSSGVTHWDRSVQLALWKTGRIPRDANGWVPPLLLITFRPKQ